MSTVEIFGVIAILLSVFLTVKNNILTWPIGIIGNLIYMYIFFNMNVIGNMLLQVVFIIQSIHGWYKWGNKDTLKISKLESVDRVNILIATLLVFAIVFFFTILTDSASPIFDSATTSLCIMGITLLSFKKIETWVFWIVSDVLFIWFFSKEGLYLSSITYLIILILAIIGLIQWKKDLKTD